GHGGDPARGRGLGQPGPSAPLRFHPQQAAQAGRRLPRRRRPGAGSLQRPAAGRGGGQPGHPGPRIRSAGQCRQRLSRAGAMGGAGPLPAAAGGPVAALAAFRPALNKEEVMSQFFQIHPDNPQPRLIKQAVEILRNGGVIAYPTDSSYALGCQLGDKGALERIRRLRRLDDKHNFTLVCCDLSQLGFFAKVDTTAFRLLKVHTPGPYTFILDATREVPRMLLHPKRRTIGLRVPGHPIAQALLRELDAPLMSVSLIMPGEELPLSDPYDMRGLLEHHVDLIIDGGYGGLEASTVVNLTGERPEVIRVGCGDPAPFLEIA